MTKSQLQAMIKQMINEEFKNSVRTYINSTIPLVISEVVDEIIESKMQDMLSEGFIPLTEQVATSANVNQSSFNLNGAISGGNRRKMTELLRSPEHLTPARRNAPLNIVTSLPGTDGSEYERKISPDQVPESVLKALNTDYREILKKMNAKSSTTEYK